MDFRTETSAVQLQFNVKLHRKGAEGTLPSPLHPRLTGLFLHKCFVKVWLMSVVAGTVHNTHKLTLKTLYMT